MTADSRDKELDDFEQVLKERTAQLMTTVEQGDLGEAVSIIQNLHQQQNASLYQEVGRLTRTLHDAISNFHIDVGLNAEDQSKMSEMANAQERLNYVIHLTDKAANKTMDKVDESAPLAVEIGQQAQALRQEWSRLMRREMKPDEFRELCRRMDQFLQQTESHAATLSQNFNDIILAQDFQDLTGQVVKRVISLVQEVEDSLVRLVCVAGNVDRITGTKHQQGEKVVADATQAEGPHVNSEKRDDVVSGQDEVDDLLSSLGF